MQIPKEPNMSLERPVNITCPQCNAEQEIIVWQSLNVQVDPNAKNELFDGNINVFCCKSCNFEASIPVEFMYHDMALKFTVQYFPFSFVNEENGKIFESYCSDGTMKMNLPFSPNTKIYEDAGYMLKPHVVFDMAELLRYIIYREKLALFHLDHAKHGKVE